MKSCGTIGRSAMLCLALLSGAANQCLAAQHEPGPALADDRPGREPFQPEVEQALLAAVRGNGPVEDRLEAADRLCTIAAARLRQPVAPTGVTAAQVKAELTALADRLTGQPQAACRLRLAELQQQIEQVYQKQLRGLEFIRRVVTDAEKEGNSERAATARAAAARGERVAVLSDPDAVSAAQEQALAELVKHYLDQPDPNDLGPIDKASMALAATRQVLHPQALAVSQKLAADLVHRRAEIVARFANPEAAEHFAKVRADLPIKQRLLKGRPKERPGDPFSRLDRQRLEIARLQAELQALDPAGSLPARTEAVTAWARLLKEQAELMGQFDSVRAVMTAWHALIPLLAADVRPIAERFGQEMTFPIIKYRLDACKQRLKDFQASVALQRNGVGGNIQMERKVEMEAFSVELLEHNGRPAEQVALLRKMEAWADDGSGHPLDSRRCRDFLDQLKSVSDLLVGEPLTVCQQLITKEQAVEQKTLSAIGPKAMLVLASALDDLEGWTRVQAAASNRRDGLIQQADAIGQIERLKLRIAILDEANREKYPQLARDLVDSYRRSSAHAMDSEILSFALRDLGALMTAVRSLEAGLRPVCTEVQAEIKQRSARIPDGRLAGPIRQWCRELRPLAQTIRLADAGKLPAPPCEIRHQAAMLEAFVSLCEAKDGLSPARQFEPLLQQLAGCEIDGLDPTCLAGFAERVDKAAVEFGGLDLADARKACEQASASLRSMIADQQTSPSAAIRSGLLSQRLRELADLKRQLAVAQAAHDVAAAEALADAATRLTKEIDGLRAAGR